MVKFPTAPEVCKACEDGTHICHIIAELADLSVEYQTRIASNGKEYKFLVINGFAEDDLFLEDLMRIIKLEYDRMQIAQGLDTMDP